MFAVLNFIPIDRRRAPGRWGWWLGYALAVVVCTGGTLCAQPEDPVDSGREALQRGGDFPWYDAESDELRRVDVRAPAEPPARPNVASEEVSKRDRDNRRDDPTLKPTPGMFSFFLMLQWAGWGLIAALIILVLVLAIRSLADRGGGTGWELPDDSRHSVSDVDRMEQLPVPLKRNLSDLLGEARRHYEQGNYNEAVVYLYSYLLVELDKAQRIRLLRGKTNRQYLRELERDNAPPTLSGLVERTMVAFEDVFFGDHDLERQRFESCFGELDEFHHHVEPAIA